MRVKLIIVIFLKDGAIMPYQHFGKIGDVWKHLPLCEFLAIEKPTKYVDTNAAYPDYHLTDTPEQEYGILLVARNIAKSPLIRESVYWRTLCSLPENADGIVRYLGSPGLALNILNTSATKYVFFDIDKPPLREIDNFSRKAGLSSSVLCRNEDSVQGIFNLAEKLDGDSFVFMDPYSVHERNHHEHSYFEGFCKVIHKGAKGMLWYGFDTTSQKDSLRDGFAAQTNEHASTILTGIEMASTMISEDPPQVNPGVLGCGILIGNLSVSSRQIFERLAKETVNLYHGSLMFGEYPGDLWYERYEIGI
jgi:23S rRNA (adenine2030-N6)-methyltransferase